MQVLTRDELLLLVGLTSSAFDQLAHAGHVALAFGTAVPGVPGRYLDLDAVAIAISQGLTPSLGRNVATLVVAGFFEEWASAVGQAETDPNNDAFLAVGGTDWDVQLKGPKRLLIAHGTLDELKSQFEGTKGLVGYFAVSVSDIIRRLRARAQEIGIDLGRPFFFAPEDPRFEQILTQVRRERDLRIARVRRGKKKLRAEGRRRQPPDIIALRQVNYPIPLRADLAGGNNSLNSASDMSL
jgi:hypothetical protein